MGNALHIDAFAGVSGDMMLGALLDLQPDLFEEFCLKVAAVAGEAGCSLRLERTMRAGLSAAKMRVGLPQGREPARNLGEIRSMIARAGQLSAAVRERAERAFVALFEAEGSVHGQELSSVHLHEAGAADALVDIVGTFFLLERLDVGSVTCSALNIGAGSIECRHGTYPVPAPATALLLRGMPVYSAGPAFERVTPTGAAILRTLAPKFTALPPFTYTRVGCGAGDHDSPGFPNVLRLFLGAAKSESPVEKVIAIEATIDDMSGQVAGYFMERALALGASDVYFTPIFMKKNRPATKLTCLCPADRQSEIMKLYFEESTTLGLRFVEMDRITLDRSIEGAETQWGPVRMKVGRLGGQIVNYHPEYEDCASIARSAGVPLKRVQAEAVANWLKRA